MKLIYAANVRMPTEKAHGYQIAKMCEEFARAGAEVELWAPERANRIDKDTFDFYGVERNFRIKKIKGPSWAENFSRFGKKIDFYFKSFSFLRGLADEIKNFSDRSVVIFSRNPEVCRFFSRLGFKVFYEAHRLPSGRAVKKIFFRALLKRVSGALANSRGTEFDLKKISGIGKILVAPNGADLDAFEIKETKNEIRNRLSLPGGKFIAAYVGHLYDWKGAGVILAAAGLTKEMKDLIFLLVGGAPEDLEKYRRKTAVENLDNVMLAGYQERKRIPAYLAAADCLLLPNIAESKESEHYTSPIKMFEYMAAGRPIVASDLPSIREILDDGDCLFIRPGSAEDLLAKIGILRQDKELSAKIVANAKEKVKNYSWQKRAEKILNFIEKNV